MLFSASILSLLVASVAAQTSGFDAITKPTENEVVAAGSTLNIVWQNSVSDAPITITLLYGASQSTLQLGDAIATSIQSSLGTYSWTVPSSVVGYATYGFKLSLDSDPTTFQYSFPFKITGSASTAASTVASSTSIALVGTPSPSNNVAIVATTPASGTTTIVVASASASSTAAVVVTSAVTSAVAVATPVASSVPIPSSGSNSTGNFTRTLATSVAAATGASSATASPSSTILPSSGAFQNAAAGVTVMGALIFSLALVM